MKVPRRCCPGYEMTGRAPLVDVTAKRCFHDAYRYPFERCLAVAGGGCAGVLLARLSPSCWPAQSFASVMTEGERETEDFRDRRLRFHSLSNFRLRLSERTATAIACDSSRTWGPRATETQTSPYSIHPIIQMSDLGSVPQGKTILQDRSSAQTKERRTF